MISELSKEQADYMSKILDKSIDLFTVQPPEAVTTPPKRQVISPIPFNASGTGSALEASTLEPDQPRSTLVTPQRRPIDADKSVQMGELQTEIVDLREKIRHLEATMQSKPSDLIAQDQRASKTQPGTPARDPVLEHIERSERMLGSVENRLKQSGGVQSLQIEHEQTPVKLSYMEAPLRRESPGSQMKRTVKATPKFADTAENIPSVPPADLDDQLTEWKHKFVALENEAETLRQQVAKKQQANQKFYDLQQEYGTLLTAVERSKAIRKDQKTTITKLQSQIKTIRKRIQDRKAQFRANSMSEVSSNINVRRASRSKK